mmetsp:Transcript_48800/g.136597  ORF Transcript_48800/g.136597 Transcript_48800/m.136597 type:complete len:149 (-) Transcript_48800:63-509(-)|eukprot:CAMPEP_0117475894 /NCGR_PEP_ID=MMETSP0784-20121206/10031_1 /TAXON_ID=39447 /ORGANISM="" /LENGTH=148 /DNA_ID=CAMNT_0005270157 /DNA_START=45 /DNA_END=491 /DNA_ORIENTATION=+
MAELPADAEPLEPSYSSGPSAVEAMEIWLSSSDFDSAWRECYDRESRGGGRSDRNISETVLLRTAVALHGSLPAGVLEAMIPEPDLEFIRGALEHICKEDPRKAGFAELEHFEAALIVVYTQLAFCADMLTQQMPGLSKLIESGVLPV